MPVLRERGEQRAPLVATGTASLDATTARIYTPTIEFTWSDAKRAANLKAHGLDFVDAPRVFEGATFTFEDDRLSYGEQRFITLDLLAGTLVTAVCNRQRCGDCAMAEPLFTWNIGKFARNGVHA